MPKKATALLLAALFILLTSMCEAAKNKGHPEKQKKAKPSEQWVKQEGYAIGTTARVLRDHMDEGPQAPPLDQSSAPISFEYTRTYLKRPKGLHIGLGAAGISKYEICKQECKKYRDQQSIKEYIGQLREELHTVEEHQRQLDEATRGSAKPEPEAGTLSPDSGIPA